MARTLKISTEGLIGLRRAAELNGASVAELDKGLEKLTSNIGKGLVEGNKLVIDTFNKLGLSLEAISKQDPGQAFLAIAGSLSKFENNAKKAAIAQALFGKAGLKLLNTLNLGADGLQKVIDGVIKTGEAFSALDAAKVEEANDALRDLGAIFTGIINQLTIQLSPFITEVSKKLFALGTEGESFGIKIAKGFEIAVLGLSKLDDGFEVLKAGFNAFQGIVQVGLSRMLFPLKLFLKNINNISGFFGKKIPGLDDFVNQIEFLGKFGAKSLDNAAKSLDKVKRGVNQAQVKDFFNRTIAGAQARAKAVTPDRGVGFGPRTEAQKKKQKTEDLATHKLLKEIQEAIRATGNPAAILA